MMLIIRQWYEKILETDVLERIPEVSQSHLCPLLKIEQETYLYIEYPEDRE